MATAIDKDQQTCLNPQTNVVVEACAGSGKTWLLTSRILCALLLDPKLQPGQILAITFTNNAAHEIEQRIRERLAQMEQADDKQLDALLTELYLQPSPSLRKHARQLYKSYQLAQPAMVVKTFHGWFLHLERFLPWNQRTSLTTRLIENTVILKNEAFANFLEKVTAFKEGNHLRLALQRMLQFHKPHGLKLVLDTVIDKRIAWELSFKQPIHQPSAQKAFVKDFCKQNRPKRSIGQLQNDASTWEQIELIEKVASQLHFDKTNRLTPSGQGHYLRSKTSTKTLDKLLDALHNLLELHDISVVDQDLKKALLTSSNEVRSYFLKQKDWSESYQEKLNWLKDLILDIEVIKRYPQILRYNKDAVLLGGVYAQCLEQRKYALGVFDFADIEITAVRNSRDDELMQSIANRLDKRWQHILIDEFQDTSPGQWQVMRAWLQTHAEANAHPSVFIVGDPKQSIYGFQGGDPEVLVAATSFLKDKYVAKHVLRNTTRRCAQGLIEVINEVFANSNMKFQSHETLQTALPYIFRVLALEVESDESESEEKTQTSNEIKYRNPLIQPRLSSTEGNVQREGNSIASWLKEHVIGKIQIINDDNEQQVCSEQDVMLLYPTRAGAAEVARELQKQGIACSSAARSNRMHDLECQDMIALLQTIYDPANGLALATVLRSPIFGLDEDDLWKVFEAGRGDWYKGLYRVRASAKLENAKQLINKWRQRYLHDKLPAHETLAACYHDANIIQKYVQATPREITKRVVRNLEWILNFAIEADGGSHAQLAEYAAHLQDLTKQDNLSSLDVTETGMVRCLTVHGAKGLESPIVVLSNSLAKLRHDVNPGLIISWDNQDGLRKPNHISFLSQTDNTTFAQQDVINDIKITNAIEQNHQLYVALTRAKQVLLISAKSSKQKTLEWHQIIVDALVRLNKFTTDETTNEKIYEHKSKFPKADSNIKEKSKKQTLTQLPKVDLPKRRIGFEQPVETLAAVHGQLLHDMLVLLLTGIEDDATLARWLAIENSKLVKLKQQALQILKTKKLQKLLSKASKVELEIPVKNKEQIQRIDCLIETDQCVWIIDFKSATAPQEEESYHEQLAGYKDALVASGESRPIKLALIGGTGDFVEI